MECCSKLICDGCHHANVKRETEARLEHRCAFCREPAPQSDEEIEKRKMERVKKNDPVAMAQMGKKHDKERDYGKALEYWTKAAELGDVEANAFLGSMYYDGRGVEKDKKKAIYHLEQAAMGGHPWARVLLADYEMKNNGRFKRAAKHYIIAANLGEDDSLKPIKDLFVKGIVSEEEYAAAIRGHQAAVDATKSPEREEADRRKGKQTIEID
jgi:TPR repeat protein